MLLYGVSAQRPSHTLFIAGEALPMEARMGGLFLGFLVGLVYLAALRLGPGPRVLTRLASALCWVLVGLTGLDGLNAFFFDGGFITPYVPRLDVRLLTGLGAGYALSVLAAPPATSVQVPTGAQTSTLGAPGILGGLSLAALLGMSLLSGAPLLLWPASLLMVVSVVAAFAFGTLHALRVLRVLRGVAANTSRGSLPTIALGLALVEIAALAALRSLLATHLGFSWGS